MNDHSMHRVRETQPQVKTKPQNQCESETNG